MLFKRREKVNFWKGVIESFWPRRSFWRSTKYFTKRTLRLSGSPHAIAAGIAAGVFASFLPFIGFHLVTAALVAWCVRGNLIASALGTAVGNPFTFPFIWAATLGTWSVCPLWTRSGGTSSRSAWECTERIGYWLSLGTPVEANDCWRDPPWCCLRPYVLLCDPVGDCYLPRTSAQSVDRKKCRHEFQRPDLSAPSPNATYDYAPAPPEIMRSGNRLAGAEIDDDAAVTINVETRLGVQAEDGRSLHDIFDRRANARKEMMVIGIDARCSAGEIRENGDDFLTDGEAPSLRVVAIRCERREANELLKRIAVRRTGRKRSLNDLRGLAPATDTFPRP